MLDFEEFLSIFLDGELLLKGNSLTEPARLPLLERTESASFYCIYQNISYLFNLIGVKILQKVLESLLTISLFTPMEYAGAFSLILAFTL